LPPEDEASYGRARPALTFELLRDLDPETSGVILDPRTWRSRAAWALRMGLECPTSGVDRVHVKIIRWDRTPPAGR
jgi:hypothetical protein